MTLNDIKRNRKALYSLKRTYESKHPKAFFKYLFHCSLCEEFRIEDLSEKQNIMSNFIKLECSSCVWKQMHPDKENTCCNNWLTSNIGSCFLSLKLYGNDFDKELRLDLLQKQLCWLTDQESKLKGE